LRFFSTAVFAQEDIIPFDSVPPYVKDFSDVMQKMLHKKVDSAIKNVEKLALLPSVGYNPSFGFVIGAKHQTVRQYGAKENTALSSIGLEALITFQGDYYGPGSS
jgi:hypothetical protein